MTVLIVGGSYQGKKEFAMRQFGIDPAQFYECGKESKLPNEYLAVNGLHLWIRLSLEAGLSQEEILDRCLQSLVGKIICCDDITSGIVPIDSLEREWREVTGRCLCALAKEAELVVRMHCGVPQLLKGRLGETLC